MDGVDRETTTFDGRVRRAVPGHLAVEVQVLTPIGDDVYDPVESTYREAIADSSSGEYPKALSEIASTVMGQGGVKTAESTSMSSSTGGGGGGIGGLLSTSVSFFDQARIVRINCHFSFGDLICDLWSGDVFMGWNDRWWCLQTPNE